MKDKQKYPYAQMRRIADDVLDMLAPHCERIEIAGSLRRRRAEIGDIEIVAIPKPYDVGLFESGIATVLAKWEVVKGNLPCKYTQRILPAMHGVQRPVLDLFFATPQNWGLILAIRTGSADYSRKVLATGWVRCGYHSENGMLMRHLVPVPTLTEQDLFRLAGVAWVEPEKREL